MASAKSIRVKLLTISKQQNVPFQQILNRFFHERFLARLAQSPFKNKLILKGGNLIYANQGETARPTTDIDFLGANMTNEINELSNVIKQIALIQIDDAVFFSFQNSEAIPINENKEYKGLRFTMEASLDTIIQKVQIDIGFGDIVSPKPISLYYPVLLDDFEPPEISAYTLQTVIAEKLHAILTLSTLNSRMKDFYDVYTLLLNNTIHQESLKEAITQTFNNRNTTLNFDAAVFKEGFYTNTNRIKMWNAFLKKINSDSIAFEVVIKRIERLSYEVFQ